MQLRRAPDLADLRRVWAWEPCPWAGSPAGREATAWHEAGHVVYGRWLGWEPSRAELHADGGNCFTAPLPTTGAPSKDETGELRATAAGLLHAGLAAELLHAGLPWRGPIARTAQADHKVAEALLAIGCGANTLPSHAYAQLLALHVLSARWDEVAVVAHDLLTHGEWTPSAPGAPTPT